MSVNFPNGITQVSPSTISRPPKFQLPADTKPAASSPINNEPTQKKKNHWFAKTIGAVVVIAAALGLSRAYVPALKKVDIAADAAGIGKNVMKYLAIAGEFINSNVMKAVDFVKNKIPTSTP